MSPQDPSTERAYFFDAGLRFSCTGCGRCCTGAPGQVLLEEEEVDRLVAFLGLDRAEFLAQYTRSVMDGLSLRERENGDCILLQDRACRVHAVKPAQCGTFPFWPGNLRSETAWKQTAQRCEGIGQGRRYTREEILALLARQRTRTAESSAPDT
jgi:uncharacterized protein